MKFHVFGFTLLSAIAIVASAPAQAQNGSLTRSFVSSAGVDTNACTIAAPCATFAEAYTKIGANGIIAALDPGKYGAIAITGPVTINGNGWAAITAPAQGTGITISAGSGNVILTGLEIDGAGTAYNGIVFESGAGLTISNCTVQNIGYNAEGTFGASGSGIMIAAASGNINFSIVNTTVVNNAYSGISFAPPSGSTATVIGSIDHVVANNDDVGIWIFPLGQYTGHATISISNSVASNNSGSGINTQASSATLSVDNDQISNNQYGLYVQSSTVRLSRSEITENSTSGIQNGGVVETFQNNQFRGNGNGNAVSGTSLSNVSMQ